MAKRLVYYVDAHNEYHQTTVDFEWFPGFAKVQKQKSIASLHAHFLSKYPKHAILEISTASPVAVGTAASAFNLEMPTKHGRYTVEQLFQASKVYEQSGQQTDILNLSPKEAKRRNRARNQNDQLVGFRLFSERFPLEPRTYFYNWVYLNALKLNAPLAQQLVEFDAFTDINANPKYTISTQAAACAIFVALYRRQLLSQALASPADFLRIVYPHHQAPVAVKPKVSEPQKSEQLSMHLDYHPHD